jgi:microsomal dipeptidase-like Zn-dependent dipeptidase
LFTIRRLNDSKRAFDVIEALIRRGYNDREITAIHRGNTIRVVAAIWG